MIPLYAFIRGDSLGLVVLVDARQTIREVAQVALGAASVRVAPVDGAVVHARGERLDPELTVEAAGLLPLERIDVGAEA